MLAISGLDVAFVSAIAAVAAAVAAPLSAWLVALATHRHERWVKTYDDVREAYQNVLRALYASRTVASALAGALEANDASAFAGRVAAAREETDVKPIERLATAAMFASAVVTAAMDQLAPALEEVTKAVDDVKLTTEDGRIASAAAIRKALRDSQPGLSRLREAIRTDLRKQ
jgi:hypothetical protein